jgi:hypothetical protein
VDDIVARLDRIEKKLDDHETRIAARRTHFADRAAVNENGIRQGCASPA